MVLLLERTPTEQQLAEMLEALDVYIKLAVDVERGILSGGGTLHADCEAVLLEHGSEQQNIWGADWLPHLKRVTFESLINIRPHQNNFALEVQDAELRKKIESIVRRIFEGDDNS